MRLSATTPSSSKYFDYGDLAAREMPMWVDSVIQHDLKNDKKRTWPRPLICESLEIGFLGNSTPKKAKKRYPDLRKHELMSASFVRPLEAADVSNAVPQHGERISDDCYDQYLSYHYSGVEDLQLSQWATARESFEASFALM
ncbi:hypothetical protein ACIBG0_33360 [Nocardia sp. NPDC050630]|uniref:hypothetical protein n=1 Tax=Nocardia sp. NPDC050630 TaxID=3364321 RepID=UPI003796A93C